MVTPTAPKPLKKHKTYDPSPSVPSSQAGSSKVGTRLKAEKPVCKWSKQDQVPPASSVKAGSSVALSKKSFSKDKGRAESLPVTKESSAAPDKPPGKPCSHKPVKAPLMEVPTVSRKKEATPPHTVLSEDTHVDIQGHSPTPITAEYMLDCIFTDLPMLSALSPSLGEMYYVCWALHALST
ncbi:hypothetical protein ARMSODRAFT_970063 [Armillaria solidipes]|uniref:Uncharacterized protein n=1 Tax=Armillaria solidipes TaxID=1076256 RepID=A0A2H3BX11_9AGAR|nr:hypothetical protein ARMSODRAFT_970063 [Armillaria solidipes]